MAEPPPWDKAIYARRHLNENRFSSLKDWVPIEVTVTPGAVSANEVEFELVTPSNITWRKEIVIRESPATGTGAWTVWTQDGKHRDANGLYLNQLPGGTLTFRKMKFGGGVWPMLVLGGLRGRRPRI